MCEIIRNESGDLAEDVELIDAFYNPKKDRQSLCYRISYRSHERNLLNSVIMRKGVEAKEIDAIQEFLDQASEHVLCPGEEVEILCGAMKHVSGKVKKIKKNHLVLYLEQLGATVCVKLDDVAWVDRLK